MGLYMGFSRSRKTSRNRPKYTAEQRRERRQQFLDRRIRLESEVDSIWNRSQTEAARLAAEFNVSTNRIGLMLGMRGAEGKITRKPNPYNGWAKAEMARINSGKPLLLCQLAFRLTSMLVDCRAAGRSREAQRQDLQGPIRTQVQRPHAGGEGLVQAGNSGPPPDNRTHRPQDRKGCTGGRECYLEVYHKPGQFPCVLLLNLFLTRLSHLARTPRDPNRLHSGHVRRQEQPRSVLHPGCPPSFGLGGIF